MRDEVDVDDLDLRLFRWMYPGGVWSWWGMDPRISTTQLASHIGLERTAVWARFRKWRSDGFWNGFGIRANPRIFGTGQVHVEIPVRGSVQGADLIDHLERVDGVLWARLGLGTLALGGEGEVVLVTLAAEDEKLVRRRLRLLGHFSSTGDLEGPFHDETPPCPYQLTPLDWRILAAVSANPNASTAQLARLVGVTLKTVTQHRARLIEHHAIFYVPQVDWSKLGCVVLGLFCRSVEDAGRARAELEGRFPASIPMSLEGFEGIAPEWDSSTCVGTMVPAHSPNVVHALVRSASRIPGVRFANFETWGPERLYLDWPNRRIAEHLAASTVTAPGSAPHEAARRRIGHSETSAPEGRGVVT